MDILFGFSTLIWLGILVLVITNFGSHLHKHETKYYIGMAVLSIIGTVMALLNQFGNIDVLGLNVIYPLFFQGHLTLAFFIIVMYGGAFKKKSKAKITIMKVRREMAILGFLTLIPHAVLLIVTALSAMNPTGVIATTLLLPLFVTSFPKLRKKMHPVEWRGFHRWAYLAYLAIFAHLAAINIIAQDDSFRFVRLGLYIIIFGLYTFLKFKNHILVEQPKTKQAKNPSK